MSRRRKTAERRRLLAIFEEEARDRLVDGRIDDFEPAVKAASERLGPYPTPDPWWGSLRAALEELLRYMIPDVRRHLISKGKMIHTATGEGEGAAGPLQLVLFEWTDYRARITSRADALDAHRTFVDAVDDLLVKRGADHEDHERTVGDYISAEEYQELYDEHVGGSGE